MKTLSLFEAQTGHDSYKYIWLSQTWKISLLLFCVVIASAQGEGDIRVRRIKKRAIVGNVSYASLNVRIDYFGNKKLVRMASFRRLDESQGKLIIINRTSRCAGQKECNACRIIIASKGGRRQRVECSPRYSYGGARGSLSGVTEDKMRFSRLSFGVGFNVKGSHSHPWTFGSDRSIYRLFGIVSRPLSLDREFMSCGSLFLCCFDTGIQSAKLRFKLIVGRPRFISGFLKPLSRCISRTLGCLGRNDGSISADVGSICLINTYSPANNPEHNKCYLSQKHPGLDAYLPFFIGMLGFAFSSALGVLILRRRTKYGYSAFIVKWTFFLVVVVVGQCSVFLSLFEIWK